MPEQEEKLWHPVLQIEVQEQVQQVVVEARGILRVQLRRHVQEQVLRQQEKNSRL